MNASAKRGYWAALICSLTMALCLAGPLPARSAQDQAGRAATEWLALVDGGDYRQAWSATGELIRDAMTAQAWESLLEQARRPLGEKSARQETSRRAYEQLPGAPDGQYLVLTFDSSFAHKARAMETLTLRREADGVWRVVGYFIR
ncbi:conserved hypothetical protein [Desulfarculus baarsii DSM 2075]|uniref:DUF4019 domain-containing protein n=1 Tax=Desulfarculus baarsii (strain ATCC 33931 / DSM 2075 / LMG 7858 / VKM B-1802 / 2st14) TaxID=644282 RepID=E1QKP4_DESB2|nr:DUF4019 domain-containing protein [Desulfarculus baarsii]ADK86253.1 conserved hypothetical protein [Desulfarculus baarsii DSM 2075]